VPQTVSFTARDHRGEMPARAPSMSHRAVRRGERRDDGLGRGATLTSDKKARVPPWRHDALTPGGVRTAGRVRRANRRGATCGAAIPALGAVSYPSRRGGHARRLRPDEAVTAATPATAVGWRHERARSSCGRHDEDPGARQRALPRGSTSARSPPDGPYLQGRRQQRGDITGVAAGTGLTGAPPPATSASAATPPRSSAASAAIAPDASNSARSPPTGGHLPGRRQQMRRS